MQVFGEVPRLNHLQDGILLPAKGERARRRGEEHVLPPMDQVGGGGVIGTSDVEGLGELLTGMKRGTLDSERERISIGVGLVRKSTLSDLLYWCGAFI